VDIFLILLFKVCILKEIIWKIILCEYINRNIFIIGLKKINRNGYDFGTCNNLALYILFFHLDN
jgi:hypothetical protein